jgi:hypothetical protein
MPLSPYCGKAILDWLCGGAVATRPGAGGRWVGLSDANGTEVSVSISGYARQTAIFNPAASPVAGASIAATMLFGTYSASSPTTVVGVALYDNSVNGNLLLSASLASSQIIPNTGGLVMRALSVSLLSIAAAARSKRDVRFTAKSGQRPHGIYEYTP